MNKLPEDMTAEELCDAAVARRKAKEKESQMELNSKPMNEGVETAHHITGLDELESRIGATEAVIQEIGTCVCQCNAIVRELVLGDPPRESDYTATEGAMGILIRRLSSQHRDLCDIRDGLGDFLRLMGGPPK